LALLAGLYLIVIEIIVNYPGVTVFAGWLCYWGDCDVQVYCLWYLKLWIRLVRTIMVNWLYGQFRVASTLNGASKSLGIPEFV